MLVGRTNNSEKAHWQVGQPNRLQNPSSLSGEGGQSEPIDDESPGKSSQKGIATFEIETAEAHNEAANGEVLRNTMASSAESAPGVTYIMHYCSGSHKGREVMPWP